MNSFGKIQGRPENDQKIKMYIQDDENTMMYKPGDMQNNKFFGTWSKLLTLSDNLNLEIQEKYYNDYQAYYKARLEVGSAPICF